MHFITQPQGIMPLFMFLHICVYRHKRYFHVCLKKEGGGDSCFKLKLSPSAHIPPFLKSVILFQFDTVTLLCKYKPKQERFTNHSYTVDCVSNPSEMPVCMFFRHYMRTPKAKPVQNPYKMPCLKSALYSCILHKDSNPRSHCVQYNLTMPGQNDVFNSSLFVMIDSLF